MTTQEILELAGHRDVPPWVMKLVADCVAKEREECAKACEKVWDGERSAKAIRARGQQ